MLPYEFKQCVLHMSTPCGMHYMCHVTMNNKLFCHVTQPSKPSHYHYINYGLIKCGKAGIKRKACRPPLQKRQIKEKGEKRGRKPGTPLPGKVVRLDSSHHWPEYRDAKNQCRYCKTGLSQVYSTTASESYTRK